MFDLTTLKVMWEDAVDADRTESQVNYGLVACLISGLILAVAGFAVNRELSQTQERATRVTANTAVLIEQMIESMFVKIDVSLQSIAQAYKISLNKKGGWTNAEIDAMLAEQRRLQPEIVSLRITDADGIIVHGLDAHDPQRMSLADRPFFQAAKTDPNSRLIVFGPVLAKLTQKWTMVLARRLEDEQGRFLGTVYAGIAVETFHAPLSRIDMGPKGAASLRTSDLALVYWSPTSNEAIGSTAVSATLASLIQSGRPAGIYTAIAALDGIERVTAYHKIGDYPLYAIVGAAPQDQYGATVFNLTLLSILTLTALSAIGVSAFLVRKHTMQLNAELVIRKRLQISLRQAQEINRLGNWVWNVQTGHTYWSNELYAICQFDKSKGVPSWTSLEQYFEPESWIRFMRAVKACGANGAPYDLDCRVIRDDDETAWINVKGTAQRSVEGDIVALHGTVQDITERKQLELELAQSNDELVDLYDNAPCGIASLDATGRYLRINAVMLSWIGDTSDRVVKRMGPRDSFSEASKVKFDRHFAILLKTGRMRAMEFELIDQLGQVRSVNVNATAVFGEDGQFKFARSVIFDITDLRRAQARISEIKKAQDVILNHQMVGVVKLRDRIAIWFNPALCRIFGYSPPEMKGKSSRLIYAEDATFEQIGREAYPVLARGDSFRTQLQMRRKDGSLIWIDMQGAVIDPEKRESLWMLADITPLQQQQAHYEYNALHDALTGLANRTLLRELMLKSLETARRHHSFVGLCFLDLDNFKPINDQFGHAVGDQLLKEVSNRLLESVRTTDLVARVGGDEFVLLLTDMESAEDHRIICDRARAALLQPFVIGAESLSIGVSMGVAVFPVDARDPEILMALADEKMYQEKKKSHAAA